MAGRVPAALCAEIVSSASIVSVKSRPVELSRNSSMPVIATSVSKSIMRILMRTTGLTSGTEPVVEGDHSHALALKQSRKVDNFRSG